MPYYESVFIVRQDVPAAQVETMANGYADIIKAQGGKVTKTEQWGLRNLAYRIKKNKKGHYVLMNIEAPAAAINEMERNMRISEDVLRFMTVSVETLEAGPSVMMRREERDAPMGERPARGERSDRSDRPHRQRREHAAEEGV